MFTSEHLTQGSIYTRKELQQRFGIQDSTIMTGVFKPAKHESIWLFITKELPKDRPQRYTYDSLVGDTLYWDGQEKNGKDTLIIGHEAKGLELLVFYRQHKNEYSEYGFKYEGRFRYVNHTLNVTTQYERYLHTADGVEVLRIFHKLSSRAMENFNEHFKGIFDGHGQVPTKGLIATQRFALGAVFVYQLALLYRFEHHLEPGRATRLRVRTVKPVDRQR